MAPSPTGFLHIGGVRTFLFNWLFARRHGGENRLRIENTDTTREVAEAVEHIKQSLSWIGIEWDGEPTFQLDRMDDCRKVAELLVAEGKAYEDDGAIRFRMPDDGVTAWDDVVRGRVEFQNEQLADPVIVRSDGRPIYNFASPMEDVWDGITHVIRGDDHISNTPTQINIIRAVGAELPVYAHVPSIFGQDGKKLSKRHGATGIDEFQAAGYLPETMLNFLALLGWAPDGETTLMSRDELVERFSLEKVSSSPAQFDYAKLDWMNGVYLRELSLDGLHAPAGPLAGRQRVCLGRRARRAHRAARAGEAREALRISCVRRLFLRRRRAGSGAARRRRRDACGGRDGAREDPRAFDAESIEAALRGIADGLGLKPRKAFEPIRVAVTGSKVSPGLFESIELLGREETLRRVRSAAAMTQA